MRTSISKYILPVLAGIVLASSVSFAQQPASNFDSKAFFETLDKQRFKAPAGFDGQKFFAELEKQRFASKTMFETKVFVRYLCSRCTMFLMAFWFRQLS